MKKSNLIVAFIILQISLLNGQNISPQVLQSGQWIKNWMLVGPIHLQKQEQPSGHQWEHIPGFDSDFLKSAGGESKPILKNGSSIRFTGGSAKCILYNSPDSMVNLDNALSKEFPVLAYGYTEVEATEEGIRMLALGSNDGCRLWLNGEQIWDVPGERGLFADDDLIPVYLKKGKNTILIKVEERGGSWGFCMRFKSFAAADLNTQGKLFTVVPKANGLAEFKSSFSETVLNRLIKSLQIEIISDQGKKVLSETRTSDFTTELKLKTDDYLGYTMNLKTQLKNGEVLPGEINFFAGKRQQYFLFNNRKSDYHIIVDNNASTSEKWAAEELQHWIEKVGGIKISIENTNSNISGQAIYVGYNEKVKNLAGRAQPDSTDESFKYFNAGPDIVIYGGSQRGTMYGVMSFLENELGCRWYTPDVTVAPEKTDYSFERLNHSEKPGVRVRNDFYFEAFNPTWAARNKMNGTLAFDKTTPQPGGTENYWAVHTFYPLMPPSEFFDKHPEYYSLIDGKRIYDHAQLCLTNPDVLKIIIERIKKQMRENPEYLIYSVSQNDWRNPCQCDKCQAIAKTEGSESGPVIWFVNQVAEAVEKEFPDKFIGTLAYQYTRTPPKKIKPRQNVVVRLCSIECCFSHDFETCPENKSFMADLKGWSAIAPHLYIWDYVVNFSHYIMPYPNFYVLQPNIKTLQQNNSIGIMEQAAYQSRGGEFAELRAYVISKLLWNPDCNVQEVINDFMFGYYGRAGLYVRQYFDYLQNRISQETHIHLGLSPDDILFSGSFVSDALSIFSNAEKVAENPEILSRVEMAELPLLYLKCMLAPQLSVYDGTYEKFTRIVEREGITHYAEVGKSNKDEFHKNMDSLK